MGLFNFFKKKNKQQEENDEGGFLAFVLLDEPEWSRENFLSAIKEDWDITLDDTDDDSEKYKDIIVAEVGSMRLAVSYMGMPVPNGEAEHNAATNYMWKDAVSVTSTHKAHIMIAVLGDGTPCEKGTLLVKAASSALKQEHAIAIYSDGAVFEPTFYNECAQMAKGGDLPVLNLVWLGLYGDDKQWGIYTYGMKKFGKNEMEAYAARNVNVNDIRAFMCDIVTYVLTSDVVLKNGETIGFTEDQKLKITLSKGIATDGETLKIEYPE